MSTPFFGKLFTFTQPDGSTLQVRGWGDQPDVGRSTVTRGLRVDAAAVRAAGCEGALRFGGRRCDERRRERKEQMRALRTMAARGDPAFAPPPRETVGDYVGLCLLIDFSDVPATIARDEVERFCNRPGYNGFGNNGIGTRLFL